MPKKHPSDPDVELPSMVPEKRFSPWRPLPSGIIVLIFIGPTSLGMLLLAYVDRNWVAGIVGLIFLAMCFDHAIQAGFHAGLRAESHAEQLRRGK